MIRNTNGRKITKGSGKKKKTQFRTTLHVTVTWVLELRRRRKKLVAEESRRGKRVKVGYLSLFVDGEKWKWNA